jgi:DNA transposition AAA+ family ATPase
MAFYEKRNRAMRVAGTSPDPAALLVTDEADRLKVAGLEQVRSIFDQGGLTWFDQDAGHRKASRALSAVLLTH